MATTLRPQPDGAELAQTVAQWLRAERAKHPGLTQRAIAQELGLTDDAPGQWETARTMPRADRLMRLVVVFGFSLLTLKAMLDQLAEGAPTTARPKPRGVPSRRS